MSLLGGIVVAVVGAGDQMVVAGVLDRMELVFVGFTGDVESAVVQQILRRFP